MRSENETPSICEETDVKVICAVEEAAEEYKDCPAACRKDNTKEEEKDSDEVVKAGDLDVTAEGDSNGRVFIGRSSDLDTLTLKTSEEVTISKITLERIGYSTASNIKNVRLENDKGTVIAEPKTVDSKGQVKLTLKKDYKVVDGTLDATIVVETYDGTNNYQYPLTAGATVGFKVVSIDSTAKNTNISGKANTYTAVKYDGSTLTFSNFKDSSTKEYNWEAGEIYEVAKFKVKAPDDSSIILRGFTFKNAAAARLLDLRKYFDKAEVTIAGEKVSGFEASVNKNDELVITFKDVEVAAKAKSEVVVSIALVDDYDQFGVADNVQLILTDFVAVDGKVESRVSADKVTNQTYYGKAGLYTFKGGKIKLANTKLGNVDAALESEDVKVSEGTITVNEAIKGTFTIRATGKGAGAIKQMTVVVNGDETDASKDPHVNTTPTDNDYVDFTFTNVEIEKSGKVQFLIDTVDATTTNDTAYKGTTINFNTFSSSSFANAEAIKYDESGKSALSEVSGSISFSKVTIQSAKASMTNSMTKEVEFNNKETNTKPVFEGTYTAKKGDVKLNEFIITSNTNIASKLVNGNTEIHKVTFYVYIDDMDTAVADAKITCSNGACTANDTFNDVLVEAGESVKVKVEAEVEANDTNVNFAGTDLGTFKVQLKGEDVNGNAGGEGTANTVKVKVVAKGTFNISAGAVKETVLYKAANSEIAAFTIKPANGASETDLEEIEFTLSNNVLPNNTTNPDGYVTVKLNDVSADCTAASNVVTCSFNDRINSDGAKVSISLDNEVTGVITVTGLEINDKPQTREFKKRFEGAVVSIESMKDQGGTTQFTLNVEKDSDLTVRNLEITFDVDEAGKKSGDTGYDANTAKVSLAKVFDDEDTIEARGIKDGVRLVNKIKYLVSKTGDYANCATTEDITEGGATTTYCVITITKDENNGDNYIDFFKVGDQYARTYKSNS